MAPPFIASMTAGPALNAVYSTLVPSLPRNVSNRRSCWATSAGACVTLAKKPIRTTGAVGSLGRVPAAGTAAGAAAGAASCCAAESGGGGQDGAADQADERGPSSHTVGGHAFSLRQSTRRGSPCFI